MRNLIEIFRSVVAISLIATALSFSQPSNVSANNNAEIPIYGQPHYFSTVKGTSFSIPVNQYKDAPVGELVENRTENSKTSYLGNGKYSLAITIGAIHYKNNYSSSSEQWKDIDLTPVQGRTMTEYVVKAAPYELTIDGLDVTVKDKKTGSIITIKLTDIGTSLTGSTAVATPTLTFSNGMATAKDIFTDTDLEISWSNTQISYTRILKSDKASTLAKYDISQTGTGIAVRTKAVDSKTDVDKSVPVISEIKDGILTESIDTSTHTLTYPVRIDPTLDIIVDLGTDDCYTDTTTMYTTRTWINIGYAGYAGWRFRSVSIASGSTITDAWLDMWSASSQTVDTVRTKVSGEQSATSATFSTYADYGGRTLTTNQIDWDFTTDWAGNAEVDSTNIKTIIQELVDDYSGLSSANISILIKDDSSNLGALRQIWTYEGCSSCVASLHIVYSEASLAVTTNSASSIESTTTTLNGNITTKGSTNATQRGFAWGTTSNTTKPASTQALNATYGNGNTTTGSYGVGTFNYNVTGLTAGTTYYYRAAANDTAWAWGDQVNFTMIPGQVSKPSASVNNYTRVNVTWTAVLGATGYYVFRGATDLGNKGNVTFFEDTGADAPVITPGTATATDGTYTNKVALTIAGNSIADGTKYHYTVKAFNAAGNGTVSDESDEGYRVKASLTYAWQVSAADSDATFGAIAGGTTASYDYTGAPAPNITAGTPTATDGSSTSFVTLSISGESANTGGGRYYLCVLSATGSTSQNTTHDRGYMGVGALAYQWMRSASTSDASYSNLGGATTDPYSDTTAPAPTITAGTASATDGTSGVQTTLSIASETGVNGAVRYYLCNVTATGAANANTTTNDGYRGTTTLTYQWTGTGTGSEYSVYMNDPFSDNSFDTNKFTESTNANSLVVEQNSRLEVTSGSAVSGFVRSTNTYNMTEMQTLVKVSLASTDGGFKLCPTLVASHQWDVYSEANWYDFQTVASNAVTVVRKKNGAAATLATSGALTCPYWLRMRVTSGTIYFEYANNNATKPGATGWDLLTSEAWNLGVPLTTNEYIYMSAYNTPTTGKSYFTDFEVGPSDSAFATIAGATTDPYNDTAAPVPTITAGTTSATDGTSTSYVTLSNSGETGNNGLSRHYKGTISMTGATTVNTTSDTGYRGTSSLGYQWMRSSGDAASGYANITSATSDPYNDVDAPADGSGRYFLATISMTGAASANSTADRGYRLLGLSITSTGISLIMVGKAPASETFSIPLNSITITNTGDVAEDVAISGTDMVGTANWTLSDTATIGSNVYGLKAGLSGGSYNVTVKKNAPYNVLISNLAVSGNQTFGVQLYTPSTVTDSSTKKGTVSLVVTAH
jgi:hypothetical protein